MHPVIILSLELLAICELYVYINPTIKPTIIYSINATILTSLFFEQMPSNKLSNKLGKE